MQSLTFTSFEMIEVLFNFKKWSKTINKTVRIKDEGAEEKFKEIGEAYEVLRWDFLKTFLIFSVFQWKFSIVFKIIWFSDQCTQNLDKFQEILNLRKIFIQIEKI